MKYIIVTGNPVDGFSFIGPFDSIEEADQYAEGLVDKDYWITHLDQPEDE